MEDKRMNEIEEIEATEVDETQDSSNAGALLAGVIGGFYGKFREAVIRGEIPVCKEISMEMNRIDDLIANPGIYYDAKKLAEAAKTDKAEIDSADEDSEEN